MSPSRFVWWRGWGLVCAASVLCVSAASAQTDFGAAYGGRAGGNALLPWFVAGPADGALRRDTLIAITHDDASLPATGEFVHIRLFDVNSVEACDICREWTREDMLVEGAYQLATTICGSAGQAMLDAGDGANDGRYVGYMTFEASDDPTCDTIDEEGDFVPYFYQTQLQNGIAAGFTGPVFEDSVSPAHVADFEEYALPGGGELYFRLLVGLDTAPGAPGENGLAETQLVIWSDRSGACGGFPDSFCLAGPGFGGALRVCDEEENCSSVTIPALGREVNFVSGDSLVPLSFVTNGGWVTMVNPTGAPLNVLGYADNAANGLGATLNWRTIFPAQRR